MNKICFLIVLAFVGTVACTKTEQAEVEYWPKVTVEVKPWTRWWWLGSAVDQQNIKSLINEYSEKGIGGVEITPIYGVIGEEENYIDFLSPKWTQMLKTTVEAAAQNGMGVDMNTGTGWPFGGPTITDEFEAKKMQILSFKNLEDFKTYQKAHNISDDDVLALSAVNRAGERVNLLLPEASVDVIRNDERKIYAVTERNTGQQVKRAAPGGEGLVFNHFSEKATSHYLERFHEALGENPGVRCFFNDSYELANASSERSLFAEFQKQKGYDLALFTRELSGQGEEDEVARIKADYRDVLDEMLLQNFTRNWTNWAHRHGARTKNQAHGSPGNLIDLYAAVDIPEMETFHATHFPFLEDYIEKSNVRHTESNVLFKKFASSAAHMKAENLVSCETFTWLNEHFNTPLYQCKPELDELFVKGVTHLFFHGTAYSPKDAAWPGWLFYASAHLEPNNPQWAHIQAMNEYITRCQSVLQQGKHTNEFLVFWSPDDYNHDAKRLEKKLTLHNSERWVHMPGISRLLDKGYQFDFVTDRILNAAKVEQQQLVTFDASKYKAIVMPHLQRIKLASFKKLLEHAEAGATVIFSNLPEKVAGFNNYKAQEKELAELLAQISFSGEAELKVAKYGKGTIYCGQPELALKACKIQREKLIDYHIKNISRTAKAGTYYFIANHEDKMVDEWLPFKHGNANAVFMNPMNGAVYKAQTRESKGDAEIRVRLNAGESMIVFFSNEEVGKNLSVFHYAKEKTAMEIGNQWKFKSLQGGPEMLSEKTTNQLEFWTTQKESAGDRFAGVGEYSTVFELKKKDCRYLLRLDKVEASAKVFVNEQEVATLWSFPFQVDVTNYLKDGKNTLRFEVANLGANRIRHLDREGVNWKKFHNINIVNLHYKKLDATNWPVLPSGLSGKVKLVELEDE